jgi:hypothetical protein
MRSTTNQSLLKNKYFLGFILLWVTGCGFLRKNQPTGFYHTWGGWDVAYIPIIEPYRATSTTRGETWFISDGKNREIILRNDHSGGIPTRKFGVTKNYIFGQTDQQAFRYADTDVWFIFDVNTGVYADYESQAEMENVLHIYEAPVTPMYTCAEYQAILKKEKKCDWYPAENTPYPTYPSPQPTQPIKVDVEIQPNNQVSFSLPEKITPNPTKIYYFKINLNTTANELFYISVDACPPQLIQPNLVIPAFIYNNQAEVTVYTPFTVAEQKGIPEEKRVVKSKILHIE